MGMLFRRNGASERENSDTCELVNFLFRVKRQKHLAKYVDQPLSIVLKPCSSFSYRRADKGDESRMEGQFH